MKIINGKKIFGPKEMGIRKLVPKIFMSNQCDPKKEGSK